MGRGNGARDLVVAAVAAALFGCASDDQAGYRQPTYQPPAPVQTQPETAAEAGPIDPLVAEEQRTSSSPYKPVLKAALVPAAPTQSQSIASKSGTQDVAALIQASRAAYPGTCACPYDRDRAGRKCGGRSAYSRAGGYSVLCYPSDVQ